MKICVSLGSADINSNDIASADMVEVRTDIFDTVPENILKEGQTGLITFRDGVRKEMIPSGWMADVSDAERPDIPNTIITSHHDFDGTPDAGAIAGILNKMDGDIVKGAFSVNAIKDNVTLLDASRSIKKRHVIIGMGNLGTITRIRQKILNNEFTFAHAGKETAPGQLSLSEMESLGDDCMITGIIGSGIGYTRSPAMHNSAFSSAGINGIYLTFDTGSLDRVNEFIIDYGVRGVNITKPYKTDIIEYVDECDKISEATGAVNTVVNDNGKLRGYNTDVHGIKEAFRMNSVNADGMRALILGSGGAARSCAYFLSENGCDATITGRNMNEVKKIASEFSVIPREGTSVAVKGYDVIINCTPLNRNNERSEYPVKIEQIDPQQIVFDMVYGETHLYDIASERECKIIRGEDMLAHQGIRSFELFTSKNISFETMRCAI